MTDLLPILEAIDRRIDIDEALALRKVERPRRSARSREAWRRTHDEQFRNDPVIRAAIGDTHPQGRDSLLARFMSGAGAAAAAIAHNIVQLQYYARKRVGT